MKQMTSGMIAFCGVLALASCYSYSSEAINNANYNTLQATPNFAVVKVGDSDQMIVRLVNDANAGAITSYTVGNVGAGVLVHYQVNYRPVFDAKLDTLVPVGDKSAQQYFIVGVTPGKWTFTLTPTSINTGVSTTVTALVAPVNIGAALSKTTGLNAGDTVTIRAPANTVFSQTSVVSFQVGPAPALVGVSADSTSLRILVAPGDSGTATVTKVGLSQAPAAAVQTLTTTSFITKVPAVTVAPTTISAATALIGVPVTVTLGGSLKFLGSSHVLIGGADAGIQSVSADSATATVVPLAGSTGAITFTNVALGFLTSVPLNVPSDGKTFTVGSTFGGTFDPTVTARATAPTVTLRRAGSVVVSGPALPTNNPTQCSGVSGDWCGIYKIVLTAATTFDLTLIWQGGADLGLYRVKSDGSGATSAGDVGDCDNGGQGASGQPETCTVNAVAAGTYFLTVQFFGTGSGYPPSANTVPPAWYQFRVTTH